MLEESEYGQQQLDLLCKQVEVQEAKNKDDSDRNLTRVSQLKRFEEALKSTFTKFGNDPIEVISFFNSIEKEFGRLRVPDNLHSSLINPF